MANAQWVTMLERRGSTMEGSLYVFRSFEKATRPRHHVIEELKAHGFEVCGHRAPDHNPGLYKGHDGFPLEMENPPVFDTVDWLTDGRGMLVITSLSADCLREGGYL